MRNLFKTRYRVTAIKMWRGEDEYVIECRHWFSPFWRETGGQSFRIKSHAERVCEELKR